MELHTNFLGSGWSFPPAFSRVSKGVAMLAGEEDIKSSLQILLSTGVGERIMQPKFGCDLTELLFEPLNISVQTYIKDLVFTAIYYYEPRVQPTAVELSAGDEGIVNVTVTYTIRSTNTRHNLVFPFYLNEGNNITAV